MQLDDISFRFARPDDADEIRRVQIASVIGLCSADYSPSQIYAWLQTETLRSWTELNLDNSSTTIVATQQNQVVGFAQRAGQHLMALYVHPKYGRRGIGSYLLSEIENDASQKHCNALAVLSSTTAERFYLKNGYSVLSRGPHQLSNGTSVAAVMLSKQLLSPQEQNAAKHG